MRRHHPATITVAATVERALRTRPHVLPEPLAAEPSTLRRRLADWIQLGPYDPRPGFTVGQTAALLELLRQLLPGWAPSAIPPSSAAPVVHKVQVNPADGHPTRPGHRIRVSYVRNASAAGQAGVWFADCRCRWIGKPHDHVSQAFPLRDDPGEHAAHADGSDHLADPRGVLDDDALRAWITGVDPSHPLSALERRWP